MKFWGRILLGVVLFVCTKGNLHAQNEDYTVANERPVFLSNVFDEGTDFYTLFNELDSLNLLYNELYNDAVKYEKIAGFFTEKAIKNFDSAKFPTAEVYFYAALYINIKLPDARKVAFILNFLGTTLRSQGKFELSLQRYLQSVSIYESYGNKHGISNVYNNIGVLYKSFGDYDRALEYYFIALEMKKEIDHEEGIAAVYANIATLYNDIFENEEALKYQKKAVDTYKKMDDKKGLAIAYNNMASYFIDMKSIDSAYHYNDMSYQLNKKYGGKKDLTLNILNFSSIYYNQGAFHKAKLYAENGLQESDEMGTVELNIPIYELLMNICDSLGDYNSAFQYQTLYFSLRDSLFGSKTRTEIEQLDLQYQTQKKEATIESQRSEILERDLRLNRRNTVIYVGVVLLLLLIAFFAFWLYRARTRRQKELSALLLKDERQKSKEIIEAVEEERQRIARDLHDGLGQNLAAIKLGMIHVSEALAGNSTADLRKKVDDNISFVDQTYKETRNLSHQMMPKALFSLGLVDAMRDLAERIFFNAGAAFTFDHNLDSRYNQVIEIGVYRIFQEVCNNIIKHANASKIDISLLKTSSILTLIVEDNGKGFIHEPEKEIGIGVQNMQNRANTMNGTIELTSMPGKGATVLLRIPLD